MKDRMLESGVYFVDNFAGGGGASTGIEFAIGRSVDIAINHDPQAIAMHKVNHPNTKHYCEDVWKVDPVEACGGHPVALAWFSPDCKHFSRAKGGKPVDKNIRGLAWVAVRWAKKVRPSVIMMENVAEITTWGPLGADNKPDKSRSGQTFNRFINALKKIGYAVEWRMLTSCDYGAPTRRKRFYMIARCDGRPVRWPEPTHGRPETLEVNSGLLKPWRTAAECINWNFPMESIFDRKKPLAEKTMRRIAKGIEKFVIGNDHPFIVETNHGGDGFRGQSLDEPLSTITAKHGFGVVAPVLIQYHDERNKAEVRGQVLTEPIMTLDASNRYGLIVPFLSKYYGGGYTGCGSKIDEPVHTITAVDHNALVAVNLIELRHYSVGQRVDEPLGAITSRAHHMVVETFLIKYYGSGENTASINDPLPTVTPKDRMALVKVCDQDFQIADIWMRMLQPRELFNAQGFPRDYVIDHDADGHPINKTEQVAKCGNAVTPQVPESLVRANLPEYAMVK